MPSAAALSLKLDVSEAAQKALDLKEEVRLRQPGALSTQRCAWWLVVSLPCHGCRRQDAAQPRPT